MEDTTISEKLAKDRANEVRNLLKIRKKNLKYNAVPMLINRTYGGWNVGRKATETLRRLLPDTYPELLRNLSTGVNVSIEFRTNPIVVGLFFKMKEAGKSFSGESYYCKECTGCEYIDEVYMRFIEITEEDGLETVEINKKAYKYSIQLEDVRLQLDAAQAENTRLTQEIAQYREREIERELEQTRARIRERELEQEIELEFFSEFERGLELERDITRDLERGLELERDITRDLECDIELEHNLELELYIANELARDLEDM
jgi:hypothetical protein